MTKKVLINSRTSGKFKRELIDGRSHIVTTMMPIRGDITMNSKFYPDSQVTNSFEQFNMMPAPNGHPTVNGINVPAFHPVGNNKHNIGGWLRNARKKGKRVFVDFMLDEEIANNSEAGKEVIGRIESGKKIGVSTSLTIAQITNKQGKDDFGKEFTEEVSGFNFDHVAILLNEHAAGEHAGTELVLNENDEKIELATISNDIKALNEMSTSELHEQLSGLVRTTFSEQTFAWIQDIFTDSKTFIFTADEGRAGTRLFKQSYALDLHGEIELLGDRTEGSILKEFVPKQQFQPNEVKKMDKNTLVLAIIGNSSNNLTVADNKRLMAMSDDELAKIVSTGVDDEAAKAILTNSGYDFAGYDTFQARKSAFDAFTASEDKRLKELRADIVTNSEYTDKMLENKSEDEMKVLLSLISPEKDAIHIPEGKVFNQTNTSASNAASQVDYT